MSNTVLIIKAPIKRNFLFFLAVYRFSISYLVLELQSCEDAKLKTKSMDTKHAILVPSHTLNKYSLDTIATIFPDLPI